jgi:predicted nucleotidyltransferase
MSHLERWRRFQEIPPDIADRLAQLPLLLAQHGVTLAYLFGSLARGKAGHDIDLALLSPATPPFRLRDVIAAHLGTQRLDLIDLAQAPPVLRFEVLRTGRLLYAVDQPTQTRFELATLQLYRDTHPLRERQRLMLRERFAT